MNTLVDTNSLPRSASPDHQQDVLAQEAIRVLLKQGEQLCIVPQVLYEFWAVATRPVSQNGLGKSVAEARTDVAHFKKLFRFYRDERAIFEKRGDIMRPAQRAGQSGSRCAAGSGDASPQDGSHPDLQHF